MSPPMGLDKIRRVSIRSDGLDTLRRVPIKSGIIGKWLSHSPDPRRANSGRLRRVPRHLNEAGACNSLEEAN
jgi:hypothetical protein